MLHRALSIESFGLEITAFVSTNTKKNINFAYDFEKQWERLSRLQLSILAEFILNLQQLCL